MRAAARSVMFEGKVSQGFDRYEKEIKKPRLAYWLFVLLAIISPFIFLVIHIWGGPDSSFSAFHRSGSIMVSFGAIAEVFAVSIFTQLNPSGMVSVGFDEFKKKYGKLPSQYTFIVLVIVIIGTLISGFGDLVVKT
jgi:hypothetical protein